MTAWVIRKFGGTAPRITPKLLPDNFAQSAANCILTAGSLRPLLKPTIVEAQTKVGTIQDIHRFGQDGLVDTSYWFQWAFDCDCVRGQVYGDVAERTYYTGSGLATPMVTDNSIALTGGTQYPMNAYILGVPTPTVIPGLTVSGTATFTTNIAETKVYVYTYVNAYGDEGSCSQPSLMVNVQLGQTVTGTLPIAPVGNYNLTGGSVNIYRSIAGVSGSAYLFVMTVAITANTFVDTYTDTQISSNGVMTSLGNVPPKATLLGLLNMPNGMMAGFDSEGTGRDIYFCTPYMPYAWPIANNYTVDYRVVGLGCFDSTLVVLTQGSPYVIYGTDPSTMVQAKADSEAACVSKRSITQVDGGVIYASTDGLYLASASGFKNLTKNLFTKLEWAAIVPSSMNGFAADGYFLGFYNNGTSQGFMLDLITGDYMPLNWFATAGYYEAKFATLYLVVGTNIVRFNQGTAMTFTWHSKEFYSPHAISISTSRVEASVYPVIASVYADGSLFYTVSVTSADTFRLPGGLLANTWSIAVTSTSEVFSIGMAQSGMELDNG